MRTFRKRLGQKFGTRKLKHKKLRAKKPKKTLYISCFL